MSVFATTAFALSARTGLFRSQRSAMDELIKWVKTYRLTPALDQRLVLGEKIFRHIEPKLRVFVFSSVAPTPAPDVLQEVLKAIATSLRKFEGATEGEFWAWCYRVARNKISDHFRKNASDRLQTTSPDELLKLVDASISVSSLSPGVRHDLEYAMKLLTAAKPECHSLLWSHYVQGLNYAEIADANGMNYDAVRMKISRCLASDLRWRSFNAAFASNLDTLVAESGALLWVHGHTHAAADYMIGGTRVLGNPRGYPGEAGASFKPELVVEI